MKRLPDELHSSGIYKITGPTGFYYGSATKFCNRWREHKRTLNKGRHHSVRLQRAWNKYGSDAFTFDIVQTCEVPELQDIEQYWLDFTFRYIPRKNIYNVSPSAASSRGVKRTQEQLLAQSARMRGRKLSDEHRKKISDSLIGNTRTLGVKFSDKARTAIALGHSGGKVYTFISPQGVIYEDIVNIHQFCREHGLFRAALSKVANGIYKQHKGWTGFLNKGGEKDV